ncbi:MAG: hypothetical protein RXQ97_02660 [Caldivirga sp.]|nr:hypothetical protein [Vulcanisaeta sp.]
MGFWLTVLAVVLGLLTGIAILLAVVLGVPLIMALALARHGERTAAVAVGITTIVLYLILMGIGIALLITSILQIIHRGLTWWDAFNIGLSIPLVLSMFSSRRSS